MDDWPDDAPDDVEDNHPDHKEESYHKLNDQVWDADQPDEEAHNSPPDVEQEGNNPPPDAEDECLDCHDELPDEINDPYNSNTNSKHEHQDKSENEEQDIEDPCWNVNHNSLELWSKSCLNIWACGIKVESSFPEPFLHGEYIVVFDICSECDSFSSKIGNKVPDWVPGVDVCLPKPLVGPWDNSVEDILWCFKWNS